MDTAQRAFSVKGVGWMMALVLALMAGVAPVAAQTESSAWTTDAAEVLQRMDTYTGHWKSDEKQGRQGDRFHFEYDVEWMDEGRTIARIVIEQVRSDGRTVVFEGYKGLEPSGEGVYYVAASPSGRGARGDVVLEGDDFVTVYDGWTADGSVVEIRDVFEPVDGDGFVSRTFLRSGPEEEWRQVAEDRWTRVTPLRAAARALGPRAASAQQAPPQPCAEVEGFQLLDFWVGEWTVHVGDQQVGTNRIEKVLDGCAVTEDWTDARGGRGRSLFYFVPALEEWRQVWVTARATAPGGVKEKRLVEHLEDGSVRFQGEVPHADGTSHLDRTTLTPLTGGRVRQLIEVSGDGGATWRATFDAEYRPVR